MKCDCGGKGFSIVDGKKLLCDCFRRNKVVQYLKSLGEDLEPPTREDILALTGEENVLVEMTPSTPIAKFRGTIAHILLKKGVNRSFLYFNSYEFLDIYLGHHPKYRALLQIQADVVVVDYGFAEFENKRQADSLNQVLCNQLKKGKLFWLFSLGVFPFDTTKTLCEARDFKFLEY